MDGELAIIGRAKPKEPTKIPMGEVKSYQPFKVLEKLDMPGAPKFIIGDPDSLAFWNSLPDNYESDDEWSEV